MTNPTAPMIRWDRLVTALDWATTEWLKDQVGKAYRARIYTEWDQTKWMANESDNACGTACCLAGKIVLNAGHRVEYVPSDGEFVIDPVPGDVDKIQEYSVWLNRGASGPRPDQPYPNRSFAKTAARDLGIYYGPDIDRLFDGQNSIFDLWRISEGISNGIVRMPHWLAQLQIVLQASR